MSERMASALRWPASMARKYPGASSVVLAVVVLSIDLVTGSETQFPLVCVLPVGLAAWRHLRYLAYALATTLPVLRIAFEFPWGSKASLAIAGVNALVEVAAMILYAYLVGRSAAQTRRLQTTATTKEREVSQLRAFTRMSSAALQGRGLSPGLADGVAWIYLPTESELTAAHQPIEQHEVEAEISRLDSALAAAIRELDNTQRHLADDMAAAETALLDVHLAMLNDAEFWDSCKRRVREDLVKVEQAVAEEVRTMAEMLEGLKQDVMRERSADIRDIGRRVLRNVGASGAGGESPADRLASLPPDTILVARELLPSDIFRLDRVNLVALVTETNSPASHVAILARTRKIPAISDIKDATVLLATGDRLLVDAEAGTVTVAPTRIQSELFAERRNRHAMHEPAAAVEDPPQEAVTKDGVRIGLHANISRPDEAHLVSEYCLDGVGLFRSEFLFLDVAQPPTLDEQVAAYSAVARTLDPSPVVIRTMDFGGDKVPRFDRTESDLAFRTGNRGLAFSLAEKTLFRTQLQAILRSAPEGDVRVMFPMVTGVADLREARHLLAEMIEAEQPSGRVAVGAMIETPAAVIQIREIVKMVDFVSIGTNDLAHFILATDRQAQDSPGVPAFLHPSVLRATEHVVRMALNGGVGVSVCGEAAGNPAAVCLLIGMGVRHFSMNPFQSERIRRILQQMTLEEMETLARDVLGVATQAEVQQILTTALPDAGA
ncbi:phosphoenolpyruvate--protein phosphotransferase [Candidatus Accumulibacter aalborgensis]|nr:phosphoenolpyruvate--protein phosphotransferase [Candidatus Accumulibacter aalborgensis]